VGLLTIAAAEEQQDREHDPQQEDQEASEQLGKLLADRVACRLAAVDGLAGVRRGDYVHHGEVEKAGESQQQKPADGRHSPRARICRH
jgi:hypothetical protein